MAAIIIIFFLALGYRYVDNVPYEKAIFKRSTGWETYAILLKHGLSFFIGSIIVILLITAMFIVTALLLRYLDRFVDGIYPKGMLEQIIASYRYIEEFQIFGTQGIQFLLPILILSWFSCEGHIEQNKLKGLDILKNYDSFLNIILTAMDKQISVKVALKSKKIYVGLILKEQFEHVNFDNISIIPQLSGYRNKDTLKITFDCNYSEIYQKRGIKELTENDDKNNMQSLSDFRLNIKVSEIESISFFYQDIYEDFKIQDKKNSILG